MFKLTIDNKIDIDPFYLLIPEFKSIWDIDKSKDKNNALNELKYIFFTTDFKSPYKTSSINEKELKEKVKLDYMPSTWKETKAIIEASNKYSELQHSKVLILFDSADKVLSQISKFMNDFELDEDGEKNEDAIIKMLNIIDKIPKVTAQLEDTRKKIEKDLAMKDDNIRGKGTIQKRELPKSKRK